MDSVTASNETDDTRLPFYNAKGECELLEGYPTILETWKLDDKLCKERCKLMNSIERIMGSTIGSVELWGYRVHEVSTAVWRIFNVS